MKNILAIGYVIATVMIVSMNLGIIAGFIERKLATSEQAKPMPKPAADTCLSTDDWSANIEPRPAGKWACVMRSHDGKRSKVFDYAEARK